MKGNSPFSYLDPTILQSGSNYGSESSLLRSGVPSKTDSEAYQGINPNHTQNFHSTFRYLNIKYDIVKDHQALERLYLT